MTNSIYLYLHRIMINAVRYDPTKTLNRKQALWIISRYLKFMPKMKHIVLDEMIKMKLVERVNRDKVKIINEEKSNNIDGELLIKIIEAGNRGKINGNQKKKETNAMLLACFV